MFDDILEGYKETEVEEKTPGICEEDDPLNVLGFDLGDDDDWDTDDDWNAGESWSTSDNDEVWNT